MPSLKDTLTALQDANGYVALGITVAGQLVPLGKWLVSEFKAIGAGGVTISYPVLVQQDIAELDTIRQIALDDLAAINAELAKLGKPPLALPPPSAP